MVWKTRFPAYACLVGLAVMVSSGRLQAELQAEPNGGGSGAAENKAVDQGPGEGKLGAADKLVLEQQSIADKFRHLEEVLLRMAELTASTDPRRAALLKKAVGQSKEQLIGVQLEILVDLLRKDRLSRAVEKQENVDQDLRALLELLLSENRAQRIESEKARIRSYLKRLNQIIKRQKGIQGRTAGSGEPKPLAEEQGKLAANTGDLAEDIKANEESEDDETGQGSGQDQKERKDEDKGENQGKDEGEDQQESEGKETDKGQSESQGKGQGQGDAQKQSPQPQEQHPARQRLEAARQRMREAQQKLEQAEREGAVEKQEEAIRQLEQAKADLEEILRQLREEEIEQILTMLEVRFIKMLQMQREVYTGTQRLDKASQDGLTHNQEIEASRLSSQEARIVLEAEKALTLLREEGSAVAFPEAVTQVRDDMRQVVQRLSRAKVGQITQAIEEDVLAALEEMIEALKQAIEDAEERRGQPPPPGQPQDPSLVDVLAELKMIRALQMRVNKRTERYSKLIDGRQAETGELLEALDRLADRQERIHEITRDLEAGKNR